EAEQMAWTVLAAVPASPITPPKSTVGMPPVPNISSVAASPAPRHKGSKMPKGRPPLVGSVASAAAAAASSLPKASGMEVVMCTVDMVSQQCTSVSTDESTLLYYAIYVMIASLFAMIVFYVFRWNSKRKERDA
ncbi:MAG: hypothetical protein ACKPKO_21360, partial [Candidatus Fonsibacter sp.]